MSTSFSTASYPASALSSALRPMLQLHSHSRALVLILVLALTDPTAAVVGGGSPPQDATLVTLQLRAHCTAEVRAAVRTQLVSSLKIRLGHAAPVSVTASTSCVSRDEILLVGTLRPLTPSAAQSVASLAAELRASPARALSAASGWAGEVVVVAVAVQLPSKRLGLMGLEDSAAAARSGDESAAGDSSGPYGREHIGFGFSKLQLILGGMLVAAGVMLFGYCSIVCVRRAYVTNFCRLTPHGLRQSWVATPPSEGPSPFADLAGNVVVVTFR